MRRDESYIEDIYNAAADAREFVAGMRYETFATNRLVQRAVVNCLEQIGEASKRLSTDFKRQHPEIFWQELMTHRNYLAHEYFRIDFGQVWLMVEDVLPGLIETLRPLLPPNLDLPYDREP